MIEYSQFEGAGAHVLFDAESPWDETKSTHLWIVNRGAILAASAGGYGEMFYNLFKPDTKAVKATDSLFHNSLCQGLYDADFLTFFNGPDIAGIQPSYQSHFYDPDTGLNWRGNNDTALSRGTGLFIAASNFYFVGDIQSAGYALGLSLHYLTDLGQPMHAANYTAISLPIKWHTRFESLVMSLQNNCTVATNQDSEVYTITPDAYFINLAKKSKAMFVKYGLNVERDAAYVQTFLSEMLNNVIQTTSHYVTRWMEYVEKTRTNKIQHICAVQQGYNWKQIISANVETFHQSYWYRDVRNGILPFGSFSGITGGPITNSVPLQISSCVINWDDGVGMLFILATDRKLIEFSSQDGQKGGWSDTGTLENKEDTNFKTICACNFSPELGKNFDDRAVVYAVRDDGVLLFRYQTSNWRLPYPRASQITWSEWQVSPSAPKNITCLAATSADLDINPKRFGVLFAIADGSLYASFQSTGQWGGWKQIAIDTSASSTGDFYFSTIAACETLWTQIWFTNQFGELLTSNLTNPSAGEWSAARLIAENVSEVTAASLVRRSNIMILWFTIEEKLFFSGQDNSYNWGTAWQEYPKGIGNGFI